MPELYGTFVGQVLQRSFRLSSHPGMVVSFLLLVGGCCALVTVPLFGLPGYELAGAVSLALTALGGIAGVVAARLLRREMEADGAVSTNRPSAFSAVLVPFGAAGLLCGVGALLPGVIATGRALATSPCSPFAHVDFYPLLTLPSAAMACAWGVFSGFATRKVGHAAALYVLGVLVSAVSTAWPLIFGPQVFAFNHFAGYLPGPLYDEALTLRPSLLWFRLLTLLWTGLVLSVAIGTMDSARLGLTGRVYLRPGAWLGAVLCLIGIVILESQAPQLGFRMNHATLETELGGRRDSPHLVLHYPAGKKREDLERLERDLEFRYAQLTKFLGGGPSDKVHVYLYRSQEEKARLVGASQTQFAKPWLLELHLNDDTFPNATLKHELAHVVAAPFGAGPFRVTSRAFGVWPVIGIIEGFAVAADNPVDQLTLHEWVAAMRKEKLAPDVRTLLRPTGFYTSAASRAYTVVGSFIQYLAQTSGTEKLGRLYAHGDFEEAYGTSLEALADQWEAFLEEIPLDASTVNQAFARFRQGSIFARPCAREVAILQRKAESFLASDPVEAQRYFARCSALQPEEPSHVLGKAQALSRLGQEEDAVHVLDELLKKVQGRPQLEAETLMVKADILWREDNREAVSKLLDRVLSLKPSPALTRSAALKLSATTEKSVASKVVWSYLSSGVDDLRLLRLREAALVEPRNASVNYLLGRRLLQLKAPAWAERYLADALSSELPESLRKEALKLRIQAEYEAGDCEGVRQTLGELPDYGGAFKHWMTEWQDRCVFEATAYSRLLSPEEPFR